MKSAINSPPATPAVGDVSIASWQALLVTYTSWQLCRVSRIANDTTTEHRLYIFRIRYQGCILSRSLRCNPMIPTGWELSVITRSEELTLTSPRTEALPVLYDNARARAQSRGDLRCSMNQLHGL